MRKTVTKDKKDRVRHEKIKDVREKHKNGQSKRDLNG